MALRSEPGMPAAYVLLGEEMFDFEHSSGWCESRSLFIASGLEKITDFELLTGPFNAGWVEESNPTPYSAGLGNKPQQQHNP